MSTPDKKRLENVFTRATKTYEKEALVQQASAQTLIQKLIEFESYFDVAIEIGCGTGVLTRELLRHTQIKSLHLNDISSEMLYRTIASLPDVLPITPWVADAETLSLPKSSLIISNAVIQWFNAPLQFLTHAALALNEGGWLALSTFAPGNLHEIQSLTGIGLNYLSLDELLRALEKNFHIRFAQQSKTELLFDDPRAVLHHLKRSGVNAVSSHSKPWTRQQLFSFEKNYWASFKKENQVTLTYRPIIIIVQKR